MEECGREREGECIASMEATLTNFITLGAHAISPPLCRFSLTPLHAVLLRNTVKWRSAFKGEKESGGSAARGLGVGGISYCIQFNRQVH